MIPLVHVSEEMANKVERFGKIGPVVSSFASDAMVVVLTADDRRIIKKWYENDRSPDRKKKERDLSEKLFVGL